MQSLLNVLRKEWRDATRDRRSLISSLSFAIFGPLMIYLILGSVAKEIEAADDLQVAIVGAQHAPTMVDKLKEQGVAWTRFDSVEDANRDVEQAVVVTIPDDFKELYLARMPVEIAVTADFKDGKAESAARQVQALINAYGRKVSYSRLVAAGVSPDSVRAIRATAYDQSLAGSRAARISDSLIYMLLIAGFVSGALMAADSIAGERERHSLESLLSQPVTPITLVIGKWLSAGVISAFVASATMIVCGLMMARAPLEVLGLRLFIDPPSIALGVVMLWPLAFLAVSLQMLLASRARTYREAGTYAQATIVIPVAVAGSVMIGNVDYGAIGQMLPITSQTMGLKDVLLEGRSSVSSMVSGALTTLLLAMVFVWMTSRRISDERSL